MRAKIPKTAPQNRTNTIANELPEPAEQDADINAAQSPAQMSVVAHQSSIRLHMGPLPPPSTLAEYEQVVSGAAERILRMAEEQAAHRMNLEKTALLSDIRRSAAGQALATVVTFACLFAGYEFATLGHAVEGAGLITANIIGLATVFITGQSQQKQKQQARQETPAEQSPPKRRRSKS